MKDVNPQKKRKSQEVQKSALKIVPENNILEI